MSANLTYEEIKLWRSSTEKITLEEFARRLGKTINTEKKEEHDLYDMIMSKNTDTSEAEPVYKEKTSAKIISQAVTKAEPVIKPEVKKEIQPQIDKVALEERPIVKDPIPEVKKPVKTEAPAVAEIKEEKQENKGADESIFKKALTPREEMVFNYFKENKGKAITAKELAKILNLPNDYVYKYIKNLREKLAKDILVNAAEGGYILNI